MSPSAKLVFLGPTRTVVRTEASGIKISGLRVRPSCSDGKHSSKKGLAMASNPNRDGLQPESDGRPVLVESELPRERNGTFFSLTHLSV